MAENLLLKEFASSDEADDTVLFAEAFDADVEPLLLVRPEANRIVRANAAAVRLFERPLDVLRETRVTALYEHAIGALHVLTEEALERGHAYSRDIAIPRAKGEPLEVEHSALALQTAGEFHILIRISDLDARRRRSIDDAHEWWSRGRWRLFESRRRMVLRSNRWSGCSPRMSSWRSCGAPRRPTCLVAV